MKAALLALLLLAGCSSVPFIPIPVPIPSGGSGESNAPESYKREFAQRVAQANPGAIADTLRGGRPGG